MKKIETEILIQATPAQVWAVLADFESYPKWNPFIPYISGKKVVGEIIEVRIQPPGGGGMTFRPEVLKFEKEKEFRWKGKLLFKGVFDGEHYFVLDQVGKNETRLVHGEIFTGLLVALLSGMLHKTALGFQLMNEAIKAKSELNG
ncbi:SRPBCC domain-containing protein [Algoriphagus jejuensis]|uniref:SRPBCC domain-containing protein n=1 Tax=Algoriphagus jejuensis TaxID=419934 RepID=A0ABP3YHA1_9BACT